MQFNNSAIFFLFCLSFFVLSSLSHRRQPFYSLKRFIVVWGGHGRTTLTMSHDNHDHVVAVPCSHVRS
jgi:hypothetical protein